MEEVKNEVIKISKYTYEIEARGYTRGCKKIA